MKRLSILGSTGSIGRQTLDIVQAHIEQFEIVSLAAGRHNLELLAHQIQQFQVQLVSVPDENCQDELKQKLAGSLYQPQIVCGQEGLIAAATLPQVDLVVAGLVGFLGVAPVAAAISCGKTIALANKETLVAAGSVIMPMCQEHNAQIIPVDSEHSAIFQALSGHDTQDINRILLTASGGPFRTWSKEQIAHATVSDALQHPNWSMGKKITIDSATLMNKGLEIIEACWLFDVSPNQVQVIIHPQSILHSALEFVDGSIVGQLGMPDMRLPIHYALFWPKRTLAKQVPRLDLAVIKNLTFEEPDLDRFPCLKLAQQVALEKNTLPCVLNAANETAVAAFLEGKIKFLDIAKIIEQVIHGHIAIAKPTLADIMEADKWARVACAELLGILVT